MGQIEPGPHPPSVSEQNVVKQKDGKLTVCFDLAELGCHMG
jgi:hypothetical protein